MTTTFDAARVAFLAGVQAQEQGDVAEAEAHYRQSLQLLPDRASTLNNLGLLYLGQRRETDALPCFEAAMAAEPENLAMQLHLAQTLARLDRLPEAWLLAQRLQGTLPQSGAVWALCGNLLKDLGRPTEAAAALRQALALGTEDETLRYLLASLESGPAPPQPPAAYVAALFDSYSDDFENHLVQRLQYRAPQTLIEPLATAGDKFRAALDLGCGTGLCGALLRPLCQRLVGVDLSTAMLGQSRARAVYDELHQTDLSSYMQTTAERFNLLVAADVFIYIGDLEAVFAAARRVLLPGGCMAFSVEEAVEEAGEKAGSNVDYELRQSSRYAQSERYLLGLAQRHGFEVLRSARGSLRLEQGTPVTGLYIWLLAPCDLL